MKSVRLVAVYFVVVSFVVFMPDAFATVVIQKPGFSLSLPDGWVEIPQNVLSESQAELKRQAPNAKIPKYDYGFQKEPLMNWMEYPYVLIQVIDAGRIPENKLKSMPKIDLSERLKERTANLQSIMTNATIGKMQYDEAAHVIWITTQSDVVNVGKVFGISGLIPTEKGSIVINAYSAESNFQSYLPIFRQIVTSATVSPDIAYQPRWSDSSPILSGFDWEKIIVAGITGVILALVLGKKLKSGKEHPPFRSGNTVLIVAASENKTQEITNILDKEIVGIDEQNVLGNTALHIAVFHKSLDATKLLLARGANKEVQNKAGQTPLDIAKKIKWGDGQTIIKG